jgi:putative membrane protein
MHLGRKYRLSEMVMWTRWEIAWLLVWSVATTALLILTRWHFLTIPAALLAIVGTAVAVVLAFKNQQCFARVNEALSIWGQITAASITWGAKLAATLGHADAQPANPPLKDMFYRHLAWLTALRFALRARKVWENTFEPGNKRYLARLPTPESQSTLDKELATYLGADDLQRVTAHGGDKDTLLLQWQYGTVDDLYRKGTIDSSVFFLLTSALDELVRLQGAAKRIKNYPYARNYYSITLVLVKAFVVMMPFGLFPLFWDLGKPDGIERWTAWLNVPASAFVGWAFVTLEKIGENSSNPFEGGPNDVPISAISRRIEIELRTLLGEKTDLRPLEPKANVLF